MTKKCHFLLKNRQKSSKNDKKCHFFVIFSPFLVIFGQKSSKIDFFTKITLLAVKNVTFWTKMSQIALLSRCAQLYTAKSDKKWSILCHFLTPKKGSQIPVKRDFLTKKWHNLHYKLLHFWCLPACAQCAHTVRTQKVTKFDKIMHFGPP